MDGLKGVQSSLGAGGGAPSGLSTGATATPGAGSYIASMETLLGDYMERLGTRLNVLETELRYAWRALDMLSQEYVKMWERLEKLEILLYEQQAVIAQLLEFYTAFDLQGIQSTEKDGQNSLTASSTTPAQLPAESDGDKNQDSKENRIPDEAFYRSLNNAHRDNLSQVPEATDQELAGIWEYEEAEKDNENPDARKKEKEREKENEKDEDFLSSEYSDYRIQSASSRDEELQNLQKFTNLDKVALGKLKELDALSEKLLKDSQNLRELRDRLLLSPKIGVPLPNSGKSPSPKPKSENVPSASSISTPVSNKLAESVVDEKLRQLYLESNIEDWIFSPRTSESIKSRPSSQLSNDSNTTDPEIMGALGLKSSVFGQTLDTPHLSKDIQRGTSPLLDENISSTLAKAHQAVNLSESTLRSHLTPEPAKDYTKTLGRTSPSPFSFSRSRNEGFITSPHSGSPKDSIRPKTPVSQIDSSGSSRRVPTPSFMSAKESVQSPKELSQISSPKSPKSPRVVKSPSPSRYADLSKYDSGISTLSSSMSTSSSIEKSPTSPRLGRRTSPYRSERTEKFADQHSATSTTPVPNVPEAMALLGSTPNASSSISSSLFSSELMQNTVSSSAFSYISSAKPDVVTAAETSGRKTPNISYTSEFSASTSYASGNELKMKLSGDYTLTSPRKSKFEMVDGKIAEDNFNSYSIYAITADPMNARKDNRGNIIDDILVNSSPPPPPPAPTASTYSHYSAGSRSSVASSSLLTNTNLSDTYPSNLTTPVSLSGLSTSMGINGAFSSTIDNKYASQGKNYIQAPYCNEPKYSTPAYYNAAGELKFIGQHNRKYETLSDSESIKPDLRHSLGADSSDSISSYSSSSSFYPSSGTGKESLKYQKYPPTTQQQGPQNSSHIVSRYVPMDDSRKTATLSRYKQPYAYDPMRNTGMYSFEAPDHYLHSYLSKDHSYSPTMMDLPRMNNETRRNVENFVASSYEHQGLQSPSMKGRPRSRYDRYNHTRRHTQAITSDEFARNLQWSENKPDIQQAHEINVSKRFSPQIDPNQHPPGLYEQCNVLVSESGYITFPQDVITSKGKGKPEEKKKLSRGASMKTALNQVTKMIPSIDLGRRSRSHSLPGRSMSESEDTPTGTLGRKKEKKKHSIVSTMSGFIQKTRKRGSSLSLMSLSDSEQSDTIETTKHIPKRTIWDDDSDNSSLHSENITTVTSSLTGQAPTTENLFPTMKQTKNFESTETVKEISPSALSSNLLVKDTLEETPVSTDPSPATESESIFQTIGELKRSDSSEKDIESKPPSSRVSGGSREFAVSRALGKYRQRHSSSAHSDDQSGSEEAMRASSSGSDSGSRPPSNHQMLSPQISCEVPIIPNNRPPVAPGGPLISESTQILNNKESLLNDEDQHLNNNYDKELLDAKNQQIKKDINIPPNVNFPMSGQMTPPTGGFQEVPTCEAPSTTPSEIPPFPGQAQTKPLPQDSQILSTKQTEPITEPKPDVKKEIIADDKKISKTFDKDDDFDFGVRAPVLSQELMNKININVSGDSIESDNSLSESFGTDGTPIRGREITRRSPPETTRLSLHVQRTTSEEDDTRSVRSFRSSRNTSRRQSTEESIDSDDEWYRYELRKLEMMESEQWHEPVPDECYPMHPDDNVRRSMNVVLCELQGKVYCTPPVIHKWEQQNLQTASTSVPETHVTTSKEELPTSIVRSQIPQYTDDDVFSVQKTEALRPISEASEVSPTSEKQGASPTSFSRPFLTSDGSSGETSGPDSPEDDDDDDDFFNDDDVPPKTVTFKKVSPTKPELKPNEQFQSIPQQEPVLIADTPKPATVILETEKPSVQPSEASSDDIKQIEKLELAENKVPAKDSLPEKEVTHEEPVVEKDETKEKQESSSETPTAEEPKTAESAEKPEEVKEKEKPKLAAAVAGPPGSKWKLVKALKEKKEEQKSGQKNESVSISFSLFIKINIFI